MAKLRKKVHSTDFKLISHFKQLVIEDKMSIEIIPYLIAHKKACLEAAQSNFPKFFAEEELIYFDKFLDDYVTKASTDTDTYYFSLLLDNEVVGCGGLGPGYKQPENITLIWGLVHQAYHGKKLGRALLEHRLAVMQTLFPQRNLHLDTSQYTYTFFEQYGFKTTLITPNGYGPDLYRYDMVLDRPIK